MKTRCFYFVFQTIFVSFSVFNLFSNNEDHISMKFLNDKWTKIFKKWLFLFGKGIFTAKNHSEGRTILRKWFDFFLFQK